MKATRLHWIFRILSLTLILALLFQLVPAQALAADESAPQPAEGTPEARIVSEVVSLRTQTQKHYRMSDGSFLAVDYGTAIHYNDNGEWKDIDNTLRSYARSTDSTYRTSAGTATKEFARTLASDFVFSFSSGSEKISVSLQTPARRTGRSSGNARIVSAQTAQEDTLASQLRLPKLSSEILYPDVYENVDLKYEIYGMDVKESIIVHDALDSYRFTFRLTPENMTPELLADGCVVLRNSQNEILYRIPAPYMFDNTLAYSEAVHYELTQESAGVWLLTVVADSAWIEAPERVFPVTIDPTIRQETGLADFIGRTVASEIPGKVTSKTNVAVGYHGSNGQMETYYKLPFVPEIPEDCSIVRAYAGLLQNDFRSGTDSTGGTLVMYMHEITSATGDQSWFDAMTWATRPSVGPVLDYLETNWYGIGSKQLFDITPVAKKWYQGGTNYGLAITSNGNATTKCRAWFTYNARMTFLVAYRNTTGIEPYYSYQTLGAEQAGTLYISDATGQVTLCRNLVSYASAVNPFALELYYNGNYAANSAADYDCSAALGLAMKLGAGVKLNVMQRVVSENISVGETTYTCLKYTDGDGTVHYFSRKSGDTTAWYDEDGLGLKITTENGRYVMSDDQDGKLFFDADGHLSYTQDANGNRINITYTGSGSTKRISRITQKNNGGTEITVATLTYNSSGYLTGVTDAANYVRTLGYTNGKLTSISRGSTLQAQYGYSTASGGIGARLRYAYDAELHYGIGIDYAGRRVGAYYEITSAGNTSRPGAIVEVSQNGEGQTCYHDYGSNRVKYDPNNNASVNDDILTYYTFDYALRTVNAYTTDSCGKLLGASNAAYSQNDGVSRQNNRTLRTAGIGASSFNRLRNGSFEYSDPAWSFTGTGQATSNILIKEENPRTGAKALKGWIKPNTNGTVSAYQTSDNISANYTYTLSVYVNTSACTSFLGKGIYLRVTNLYSGAVATGEPINYATSTAIDGGWSRISVTFRGAGMTVPAKIELINEGVGGAFYADDMQLEYGESANTQELLRNGDLQHWSDQWEFYGQGGTFVDNEGVYTLPVGGEPHSLRIVGDPYGVNGAYQTVTVNLPGSQTYVLSGWAKTNSVPTQGSSTRTFGLRALLTYSDGTTETHYVPFCSDVVAWQFTSMAIVPKKALTVSTIRVSCVYEHNDNTAWFDDISLTREVAQTMRYDEDGRLISTAALGSGERQNTWENGNLTSVVRDGCATLQYTYDSKHNLTQASNGLVRESYTVDATGNVTASALTSAGGTGVKITASASYTDSGNLVNSVTDARGSTVTNFYVDSYYRMLGSPFRTTDPNGTVRTAMHNEAAGRPSMNYIDSVISANYNYNERGLLSALTRAGYISGDSGRTRTEQVYSFTYDSFGNTTSISVGARLLAEYTYAAKNGSLLRRSYGNGAYSDYTYDILGRVTRMTTSSGDDYRYVYNAAGAVSSVQDLTGGLDYRYTYDSIGRLIGGELRQSGTMALQTWHSYDSLSRLSLQSWRLGDKTYREEYTYDTYSRLTQKKITLPTKYNGQYEIISLTPRYDSLSRLLGVNGFANTTYEYLAGAASGTTTTLVSRYAYANNGTNGFSPISWQFTYDALGNILSVTDSSGRVTRYEYDLQSQLTKEVSPNGTWEYTYDTCGNLREKKHTTSGGVVDETLVYSYDDSGDWKDLLLSVTRTKNGVTTSGSLSYDASGNPLTYFNGTNWSFTWRNGRELNSASGNGYSLNYSYDLNGLRTEKKVTKSGTTETHTYLYASGQLLRESFVRNGKTYTLDFAYDLSGKPYFLLATVDGAMSLYYFVTNLQGDVVRITNAQKETLANYSYDAYGKLLSVTNAAGAAISDTSNIALINPLRYRGYYYDSETELYYLQSRYYDPTTSRFINADSYLSTGQDFLGFNSFAYCNNNPVNHRDDGGTFLTKILDAFADMFNEPNSYDGGGGGTGYGFSIDGGSKGYTDDKPGERKNKKVASASLDGRSSIPTGDYSGRNSPPANGNSCKGKTVDLYRAMSDSEYISTLKSQLFSSSANSYADAKFFATSYSDALQWGTKMYKKDPFKVLTVRLDSAVLMQENIQYWERLDCIGPAYLIPNDILNEFVKQIR